MTDTTIENEQLILHIEAIENLMAEKKAISDDLKDRFSLAKGEGYDVKVMKTVIARRALERAQVEEYDSLVETYENALAA